MKKYIYLAVALVMGVFTACTDEDEIEINISHNIEFSIKTKNLYDTFDVANNLQEKFLRDKVYAIGTQTFIYDSKGDLCFTKKICDFSFSNQTFETRLDEGNYTIVTIETTVDPDDDNTPSTWNFSGTNSLKDLKIIPTSGLHYIYDAIGVYTSQLSVVGDDRITIEPKAIGSYTKIFYHNWDKSNVVNVGFGTLNDLIEYKLDPSLDRDSKFIYENTESSVFNYKGSLTVEDAENYYNIIYILDNEISYIYVYQNQDDGTSTWHNYGIETGVAKLEDGKTYYGGYAFNGNSYYPSFYFGDYNGYMNWFNNLTVPEVGNITFKSPSTQWGASVSTVKSYMSGYKLTSDIKQYEDGRYGMFYAGKDSEDSYAYYFQNRTGDLLECDVIFDNSTVSIADLRKIVEEQNYQIITESDNMILYSSQDFQTLVIIGSSDSYNLVLYMSYDYFMSLSPVSRQKMMSKGVGLSRTVAPQVFTDSLLQKEVYKGVEKNITKMSIK